MPEDAQQPGHPVPIDDGTLLLRMLYDEQARLRNEVESLREQKVQQTQGGGEQKEQEEKKGGEEQGGKGNAEEDKKKQEKKKPLAQRIRQTTQEHPVATVFSIVGFIALLIAVILLFLYLSSYETTDDAFVDGHTDPISARINGYVSAIYVENTYRVKKGQLLVELDPRDNQVSKEQAAASLSQAQASIRAQQPNVGLTQTDESSRVIEAQLSVASDKANAAAAEERHQSAMADLRQAEANAANSAREERRYHVLVVKEEVSQEIYDQHATQAKADEAVVASRRETADAAQKSVMEADAQVAVAEQQLKQAQEDLPKQLAIQRETLEQRQADALASKAKADQAQLNLEYTRIYAPEDGVIGDKQVQLASQVASGEELFALTQTNDIWVTANFKETEIKKMHAGEAVDIYVDALSETFKGHVEALPGASGAVYSLLPPENATGNYVKVVQRLPVRIRIDRGQKDAARLAPGMSVEPKVWVR